MAAIVTMIAFVAAVNAAVFIDGQANGADKMMRNILAGLAGGLTGSAVMALGIARLPAGPRDAAAWMHMLLTGTLAGALLALDNALGLDLTSFLYPAWQAGVAVRLAQALRRSSAPETRAVTARSSAPPSCWDESGSNIRPCRLCSART